MKRVAVWVLVLGVVGMAPAAAAAPTCDTESVDRLHVTTCTELGEASSARVTAGVDGMVYDRTDPGFGTTPYTSCTIEDPAYRVGAQGTPTSYALYGSGWYESHCGVPALGIDYGCFTMVFLLFGVGDGPDADLVPDSYAITPQGAVGPFDCEW